MKNPSRLLLALLSVGFFQPQSISARLLYKGKVVRQLPMHGAQASVLAKTSAAEVASATGVSAHYFPHPTGSIKALALLVDFSDAPANFTPAEVDSFLNQPGYTRFNNKGSVHDFYSDVSYGKFNFSYDVKPYYRAKKLKTYYENIGNYAGADSLSEEVMKAFDATVDYKPYDPDGDGYVDAIAIFYAGAEHDGDLWGVTTESNTKYDTKRMGRLSIMALGATSMGISTICHEMGHMNFNWPDLYETPPYGIGAHSLMADYADNFDPVPPDEVLRADQGWIGIQDLDKNSQGVFPAPANPSTVYRYLSGKQPEESFYVVNRKNTGRFTSLSGKGILVFHFDMSWNESNDTTKQSITIVPVVGKIKPPANSVEPAWYFYQQNQDEFSATTKPSSAWHDGTASNFRIYAISPIADTMTFQMGTNLASIQPRDLLMERSKHVGAMGRSGAEMFDVSGARRKDETGFGVYFSGLIGPGANQ